MSWLPFAAMCACPFPLGKACLTGERLLLVPLQCCSLRCARQHPFHWHGLKSCVCLCVCLLCVPGSKGGTSLGIFEKEDAAAAIQWAHTHMSGTKVGIVGTSTGAVAAILAVSEDDSARQSVACIVLENAFSSPESVASQTVSQVAFKVLICKGNSLAFAMLYPVMLAVKALSVFKVFLL